MIRILIAITILAGVACTPPWSQLDLPSSCASSISRDPDGTVTGPHVTGDCLGQSSIGGTLVPYGLRCSEDSAISWIGVDRIGCVHAEGNLLEPTPWAPR